MTKKLYEDFLDNPEAYEASERYWDRLMTNLADSLGQNGQWRQWIPRTYGNGTPMEKDGNPIWDARSERLDRAIRIIQDPPIERGPELAAWVKSYEEEFTELPRAELVISISLSEESARLAEKLLRKWLAPETTPEEMKAFIEEHAPERPPSNPGK